MPFYRPETKFYIYILVFIFIAGLAGFLGYTYYKVRKIDKEFDSQTQIFPEKKWPPKDEKRELLIKNESEKYPPQELQINENCFEVPIEQNVKIGITGWKQTTLLSKGKYEQGRNNFYDFIYEGKIKAIQDIQKSNCWYYQLVMEKEGVEYRLDIPKGVLFVGDFAKVDPLFLQDYIGRNLQARIQFFSINKQDFDPLKFVEWEIRDIEE